MIPNNRRSSEGYGQQKKASVVGAITQTSGKTLERAGGVIQPWFGAYRYFAGSYHFCFFWYAWCRRSSDYHSYTELVE